MWQLISSDLYATESRSYQHRVADVIVTVSGTEDVVENFKNMF